MPIPLTLADNIVQGSPLAAVNDDSRISIFCQRSEGVFRVLAEPVNGGSIQKRGTDISTITGSPIAPVVVRYEKVSKINAYYIDKDYNLTEYPDILGRGKANPLNVKANPVAGLAAVSYTLGEKPDGKTAVLVPYITVFYQCFEFNKIHKLTYKEGEGWRKPEELFVIPNPLVGTALAAGVYVKENKPLIRLYYQNESIALRDAVFDGKDWSRGTFRPGNTALRGPVAATVVEKSASIFVFYRELSGTAYVGRESATGDGNTALTTEIAKTEYRHTAVRVKDTLRFYYQDNLGGLRYLVSDLEGESWKEATA